MTKDEQFADMAAQFAAHLKRIGALDSAADVDRFADMWQQHASQPCDVAPCAWCGGCSSCGDFHFYIVGRGCTDMCPMKHGWKPPQQRATP